MNEEDATQTTVAIGVVVFIIVLVWGMLVSMIISKALLTITQAVAGSFVAALVMGLWLWRSLWGQRKEGEE